MEDKNLISIISTAVITALIVGGAVYSTQNSKSKNLQKDVDDLKNQVQTDQSQAQNNQEMQNTISDLQNQIADLQNQITEEENTTDKKELTPQENKIKVAIEKVLSSKPIAGYEAIPQGVRVLNVNIINNKITINLSKELLSKGTGVVMEDAIHQITSPLSNIVPEIKDSEYNILVEAIPLKNYLK